MFDVNQTVIFPKHCDKITNIKSHENPSSWNGVVPMRTRGWEARSTDVTKLIVVFRNFAKAPNNKSILPAFCTSHCEDKQQTVGYQNVKFQHRWHQKLPLNTVLSTLNPTSLWPIFVLSFLHLYSCFSIYFSPWNPNKSYRTYWGTPTCLQKVKYKIKHRHLAFMQVKLKKKNSNLKPTDNLIISHDTLTLSMASCAGWLDYRIRKLLDWIRDWLCAWYQWQND